jgi:hypothetical protein
MASPCEYPCTCAHLSRTACKECCAPCHVAGSSTPYGRCIRHPHPSECPVRSSSCMACRAIRPCKALPRDWVHSSDIRTLMLCTARAVLHRLLAALKTLTNICNLHLQLAKSETKLESLTNASTPHPEHTPQPATCWRRLSARQRKPSRTSQKHSSCTASQHPCHPCHLRPRARLPCPRPGQQG